MKHQAALRFRRQEHVDRITVFVDSDFVGDPVSRKSTTGLVVQMCNHTIKSGSTLQSFTVLRALERQSVLRSGERRSSWMSFEICIPISGNSN